MYLRPEIFEKLNFLIQVYQERIFEKVDDVQVNFFETDEHFRLPPTDFSKLIPATKGLSWGHAWGSAWFFGVAEICSELENKPVYICAKTGGAETFLWVNNLPKGIFTDAILNITLLYI